MRSASPPLRASRRRTLVLLYLCAAAAGCSTGHAAPPEKAAPDARWRLHPQPPSARSEPPPTAAPEAPRRCDAVRCASIERCEEATGQCVPGCPSGEVYIPATGPEGYVMGKGLTAQLRGRQFGRGHLADSDLPHKVVLTRPFCMDETEVTVAAYRACVDAGRCAPPKIYEIRANYPNKVDHPVNEVAWPKAKTYCEARGQELPTEAQWEWAATGGDGRTWPWGDDAPTSCELADFTLGPLISPGGDSGCHGGGTSPVKAHPRGNKTWPAGALFDMAGNVWEWCLDTYAPYSEGDATDPLASDPGTMIHVVRGGGWNRSVRGIQAAFRGAAIDTYEVSGLGFRCVRNPGP